MQGWGTICKLRNFCNLSNRTAISAIGLQSQQSDCNLSNQTAISAIRLQSDCNLCNQSKTPRNMPDTLCRVGAPYVSCETFAISAIRLQSKQSDCSLSIQTAILLHCSWIAQIAVGLRRLQLDCGDCSLRHAVGLTNCICMLRNFCNLSNQTAISTIRLQSSCIAFGLHRFQLDCGDCSWIVEIAVTETP